MSFISEETLVDASNFATRWKAEGGEKTGKGIERVGGGKACCKLFSSLSEETPVDAANFAIRWTAEGGEKTGEGKELMGGGRDVSPVGLGEVLGDISSSLSPS